jgi:hypothetical protein
VPTLTEIKLGREIALYTSNTRRHLNRNFIGEHATRRKGRFHNLFDLGSSCKGNIINIKKTQKCGTIHSTRGKEVVVILNYASLHKGFCVGGGS